MLFLLDKYFFSLLDFIINPRNENFILTTRKLSYLDFPLPIDALTITYRVDVTTFKKLSNFQPI